jgi:hypothetical protein
MSGQSNGSQPSNNNSGGGFNLGNLAGIVGMIGMFA